MKTNHLLSALLVLATLAGCAKEMVENPGAAPAALGTQTFTATVESPVPAASTKSFDGTIKAFQFNVDDEIAISDGTTTSVFTATEVADGNVTFTIKADETPLATEGVTYKAYYPASIAPGKSGVEGQTGMYMMQQQISSNGEIPDGKSINYTESIYEANPMYAESTTSELYFTNLCGLICITLTQPEDSNLAVAQAILQSASKPLFGPCDVVDGKMAMTASDDPAYRRIAAKNTNAKYITASDKYYLAVPEGVYNDVEFILQTNTRLKQHFCIKAGSSLNIERNKFYTLSLCFDDPRVDLTDGDPILGDDNLGRYAPANCYLIKSSNSVKKYVFKATRGCETEPLAGVASVEVLWRAQSTKTMTVDQIVMNDGLAYKDGYIYFTTSNNRGNALIGARDAEGNLLWSWHIWMPDSKTPALEIYPNGSVVLDRNVGALETSFVKDANTNLCSGLYYQWGRKDPFPSRTTNTTAVTPWTGTISLVRSTDTTPTTIAESIKNPGTYYATNTKWTNDADATWDTETKSIYDPCPAGYRVWNDQCWSTYTMSDITTVAGVTISTTATNAGYTITLPASTAYYAVNGSVKASDGKLSAPCTMYRAWSRTLKDTGAQFYHIQNGADLAITSAAVKETKTTSYGMGVRCEKIQ